MKIFTLTPENWKSDGGPVFGVVPKAIWSKNVPVDDNNLINTTSRLLLVDLNQRIILFDTGMGNKQDERFFKHRHRFNAIGLEAALNETGFSCSQITDVVFTHLHYDHVGGAVIHNISGEPELLFPKAKHYVSKAQWDWAIKPNKREAASYLPENLIPLEKANVLHFIDQESSLFPNIELRRVDGHTMGQLFPIIKTNNATIAYVADFIPSAGNIPIPYITAYDIQPLLSLQEKEEFLEEAVENHFILVFQHDYYHEACTLQRTSKGIAVERTGTLADLINYKSTTE